MPTLSPAGQLEALFAEVISIAVRLRSGSASVGFEMGLSCGVSGVLQALGAGGPQTVPGIARQRHSSRQNIQVVVNRLKRAGLVELEDNPAHRRSALVRLTEEGKAALRLSQQAESRRLVSLLLQIPEEDLPPTVRVLSQIRQSLAGPAGRETGLEQANLLRLRSARETKPSERRQRLPKPPVVEESTSNEEDFPLNLL